MQSNLLSSIRNYLEMNQDAFAKEINVSKPTLVRMESGSPMKADTEKALMSFLKSRNIAVYDKGFEEKDEMRESLYGMDGFHTMYRQMYSAIRRGQGDLWLYNGVSHLVADALGEEFILKHRDVMAELEGQFSWRVVVEEGDDAFWGHKYAYYKWIPKEYFNNKTIYVYGNTVAIVDFDDDIRINLTHSKDVTDTMRLFLETTWEAKAYDPDSEKPFRPK
jgi:transcriptional regulator with XRE-family HTH domain